MVAVDFREGVSIEEQQALHRKWKGQVVKRLFGGDIVLVKIDPESLQDYQKSPLIERIESDPASSSQEKKSPERADKSDAQQKKEPNLTERMKDRLQNGW
ncbi:hypothetical protein [Melghirimyces profundicolus]|uniref:hypothetical protein n=1 Tax=Melghirimyces profundicolus TaxID=1242148 RepID=UPI000D343D90|nr:hypothetical protein [Melghirimyces profundicolus]